MGINPKENALTTDQKVTGRCKIEKNLSKYIKVFG